MAERSYDTNFLQNGMRCMIAKYAQDSIEKIETCSINVKRLEKRELSSDNWNTLFSDAGNRSVVLQARDG